MKKSDVTETSEMLAVAIGAAKRAGKILLAGFSPFGVAGLKGKGHLVTRYDLESEKAIISAIRKKYLGHSFLAEESGASGRNSQYTWIIDPLDGTRNFTKGNPFFSVSIAVSKGKEIIAGVVYAPFLNELYYAEKGKGSYLNGKRIRVSEQEEVAKSFLVGCEGSERNISRYAQLYNKIRPLTIDMRKLGSAAIECSWVASGRAEAYIATRIQSWDISAGILLVKEAGGKVTDFGGKEPGREQTDFVASNGKVHNELLKLLADVE